MQMRFGRLLDIARELTIAAAGGTEAAAARDCACNLARNHPTARWHLLTPATRMQLADALRAAGDLSLARAIATESESAS